MWEVLRNILLINQMVAMVTEKKWSWVISTFTKLAVRMKSSKMKTRLPAILTFSAMLNKKKTNAITLRLAGVTFLLLESNTHSWYRKELRNVNSNKGSWAISTLRLLNM